MRLAGQMVKLSGLDLRHDPPNCRWVRKVGIMQKQSTVVNLIVSVKVTESGSFQRAGTTDKTVNFVAFVQQELRQVGAILACYSGNECG